MKLHALPLGIDLISFTFLHPSGEVIWATGDPRDLMRTRDENNVMAAIRVGAERYPILARFKPARDQIIGVWCTEGFGRPKGQVGHFLTFRPDGTGRYDLESLCGHDYFVYESTTFRWSLLEIGQVTIVGVQSFRFRLHRPLQDVRKSEASFQGVPFEIDIETDERGRTALAFRANLWMPWENAFGLRTTDCTSLDHDRWLASLGVDS